jgi:hypothetical protein
MSFKNYLNVFQFDTALPGSGKELQIKPITTGQMKRLLLYEAAENPEKIEEILDTLINECVVTKDFDVKKCYLQDRFFLLVELRKISKGNSYIYSSVCKNTDCNSQFVQQVDLTQLPLKTLSIEKRLALMNGAPEIKKVEKPEKPASKKKIAVEKAKPVTETPVSQTEALPEAPKLDKWNVIQLRDNIAVELQPLTREMQEAAQRLVGSLKDEIKKRVESISFSTAMGIKSIITPDGREDVSVEDKVFLLENLTQFEYEKINKWYEENDFGMEFAFTAKCPHCGTEERREIPLEDFFS